MKKLNDPFAPTPDGFHLRVEQTLNGFTRNASRRLDAELCLISLCQPELQLDVKAVNARLTRLEEQFKSGMFVSVPVEHPAEPAVSEEFPPALTDEDAPPELIQDAPSPAVDTPVGFWTELVAAVRQELRPPLIGFFADTPNSPIKGVLRDGKIVLVCANEFTAEMLNKPELLSIVGRKASAILNRPVSAAVEDCTSSPKSSARMEQLMRFGQEHRDIVRIKKN